MLSEQIACPLKVAVDGLNLLESWQSGRTEEFRAQAKGRYALARVLDTKEERESVRKAYKEGEKKPSAPSTNGEKQVEGGEKTEGDL